jgi:hypothetical protein
MLAVLAAVAIVAAAAYLRAVRRSDAAHVVRA